MQDAGDWAADGSKELTYFAGALSLWLIVEQATHWPDGQIRASLPSAMATSAASSLIPTVT